MDKRNLLKNSMILRSAASVTAIVLIAAASLIPAKAEPAQLSDHNLLNPAPIVMTIEEPAEAVIEEEAEEEVKKQKLGSFASLKLAFYAFCAGAGAWLASRIPWSKIFNKRNAVIVLLLAAIMLVYRFGLPAVMEAMSEKA